MESPAAVKIRSYRPKDQAACRKLYVEGLVGGAIADNDTGLDIADIENAYMKTPGNHLWVAENDAGDVVGMLGVQRSEPGTAEIRRLRVLREHRRRGIGSALLEEALRFCQRRSYLKITLDTWIDREPAIKLFEKFGFKHSRTKNVAGRDVLYFYLDLYTKEKK